ncbi:unnamed protein product, partial [Nippostrongylus brasiliensis]|uniref:SH2 domain-containing protein n=1 Tax=Nippostrongylus brasiliensis TaxID=27835 RepID=A0A0N4YBM1_NIPBR
TDDIYGEPLTHHVSVYHSGRSDDFEEKPESDFVHIVGKVRPSTDIVSTVVRGSVADRNYPMTEAYCGPLDSMRRSDDICGQPLTHYVMVYHSGFSDETSQDLLPRSAQPLRSGTHEISHWETESRQLTCSTSEISDRSLRRDHDMNGAIPAHYMDTYRSGGREEDTKQLSRDSMKNLPPYAYHGADETRNKVDLDVYLNVRPGSIEPVEDRTGLRSDELVYLRADKLESDQQPVGFSVSISARQPVDRTISELFSSPSRELPSDTRYLRDHSVRSDRGRRHRLSPHTWTTVRERTEVTYVRKVRIERSLSPRSPPRSHFIKRVPYKASPITPENAYTCRSSNFDERVMVHHPIYPPNQSLYRNGSYNTDSRSAPSMPYTPVREVAAFDRTEWIDQHPSYIPPNRRADEIFTVGTPFVMGHVERDGNGCAYLRYQNSGLQERAPLPERLDDLPMIEEGAIECRRATVRAGLRDMDTVGLVQDEEELERRRRPIRRARQRMRNYCTML